MNNKIKTIKNPGVHALNRRIADETEICRQTEEILRKLNPSHKALVRELNIQCKASKEVQKYFQFDFNHRNQFCFREIVSRATRLSRNCPFEEQFFEQLISNIFPQPMTILGRLLIIILKLNGNESGDIVDTVKQTSHDKWHGTDTIDGDRESDAKDSYEFLCEQIYQIKEANIKLKMKLRGHSQLAELIENFENLRKNKQKLILLKELMSASGSDMLTNCLTLTSTKTHTKRKIVLRILGCDRMLRSFHLKTITAGLPSILRKSVKDTTLLESGDNISNDAKVRCDLLIRGKVILSTVPREPSLHCWNTTFEYMHDFADPLEIQVTWLAPYQQLTNIIRKDAAHYQSLNFVLSALVYVCFDEEADRGFINRTVSMYPEGRIYLETCIKSQRKRNQNDYHTLPVTESLPSQNLINSLTPTVLGFTICALLGTGKFGKIFLCQQLSDRKYYAVKVIKKQGIVESQEYEEIITEKTVLQTIKYSNHPLMVHLLSCIQDTGHIMFVLEFIQAGDLATLIHYMEKFSPEQSQFYAASVVLCFEFLHNNRIMYRDLKMENLLLDSRGYVKLVDFGLCKLNMDNDSYTHTFCGTIDYIAPELISGNYTRMVDWWTLGVLLYYMLTGAVPFQGDTDPESLESILHKPVTTPTSMNAITSSFIISLLNKNPKSRLGSRNGAVEVKLHPYFANMDFGRILKRKFPAPFIPDLAHDLDLSFFDRQFTTQKPTLSYVEMDLTDNPDAKLFFDEFVC